MRRCTTHLAAALFVAALAPADARAGSAEERRECLNAADRAQRLRNGGKLSDARDKLVICARAACPAVVRADCETWLTEVDALLPTVVITARDARGRDRVDVRVFVDDGLVAEKLDGKAIALDPGVHTFRYEIEGREPIAEQVVIREGERARSIEVVIGGPETEPVDAQDATPAGEPRAPSSRGGVPVSAVVIGALGLASVGTFAFFHLSAKGDVDDLRRTCAPDCPQDEVDAVNRKVIVANVALGAGVVALGVATYLFLTRPAAAPASPKSGAAVQPIVEGGPTGAYGGLRVRF